MSETKPKVALIGSVPGKIWGLDLREWQARAWKKVGAEGVADDGALLLGTDWILSPALQAGLLTQTGVALVVDEEASREQRVAAIHLPPGGTIDREAAAALVSKPVDETTLQQLGLKPVSMRELASDYNAALRKSEAPYALSLFTTAPGDIEKRQFKGSYKGVTDLVTKYAWPWPAFHVTRWAAAAGIKPNTITTLSLVLVCVAFWFFWIGAWIPGILAGWGMTFLDTVDGKLARTTMTYSKWGNVYDHGIDLIHPPFWYWAIYVGLTREGTAYDPAWLLGALAIILVIYVLNRLEELAFMRRFGFHIHVWRPVDSFMRVITARRNPNLLIFMLAVLAGFPETGLLLVTAWTVICFVFHGIRLIQAFASRQPVTSWMDR
ncbi:CDP-alcohol phosphatidyltransferase family protein [Henriciella aquimarina]|uniref:CDP-alcohol phosphatidyltransferase family protein n=1 Tax=Henriciella aquimarina TaxID=545261 RepID=UPI000A07B8DB|nr:CDP-alcohol phosphatidyltransferase family protein [Henriciella aquimarina]